MGDIFFGRDEMNALVTARASEETSVDRLLHEGRDSTFRSSAKLEPKGAGMMRLTASATGQGDSQRVIVTEPSEDRAGWLEFAKNRAIARTYNRDDFLMSTETLDISIPRQLPPMKPTSDPQLHATINDRFTNSAGKKIGEFNGSCTVHTNTGQMDCVGDWRDGVGQKVKRESFVLRVNGPQDYTKVSNYYDQQNRNVGRLSTSVHGSGNVLTAETATM